MSFFSTVQTGTSYGASFVSAATKATKNAVSGTANTSAKIATGFAKAAMFATVPNSPAVGVGVFAATWYAKQMTATYAPQILTEVCVKAGTCMMGPTMGAYVGKAVFAPIVVPTLTPVAVVAASVSTYVVATTLGNAIHYYTSQKDAAKSKDTAKTADIALSDFVMVDPDVGSNVTAPAA